MMTPAATAGSSGKRINGILGTKEARRAAALALAARELHAEPEIEKAGDDAEKMKEVRAIYGLKYQWAKEKEPDAVKNSASKMIYPDNDTRGINYRTTQHKKPASNLGEAPPTTAYRRTRARRSTTHVNPVETENDFKAGGKNKRDYSDCKYQQQHRNVANAEKIIGTKDKIGYGYSTNRATPHIHAKIAAHMEEDKKAWSEQVVRGGKSKREFDSEWQNAMDAKALRVHGKTQFAGNNADEQQYDLLSTKADDIPTDYREKLLDARSAGKKRITEELNAHDELVKHYIAKDAYQKSHPPEYKEVELGNGKKGKIAVIDFEAKPEMKYYRELNLYKTAKARGEPVGQKPRAPKGSERKGLDVNAKRKLGKKTRRDRDIDDVSLWHNWL